jgi:predicted transcriptional regulator
VVAAEDEEVFGVLDLVREQEANSLERLLAAVNIVSKEQVVGLGRLSKVKARTGQCVHLAESLERPRR